MKFYLKKAKTETHLVMLRINDQQFNNGRFVYSTRERIEPENWDAKAGQAKKGHEDLNERLAEIKKNALSFIRINRSSLTSEILRYHLDNGMPRAADAPLTLIEEWQMYLDSIKGTVVADTMFGYQKSFDNMKDFLHSNGLSQIIPRDFTNIHYKKYYAFLKSRYKPNTCSKKIKHFRMFINSGIEVGFSPRLIKINETAGLKISLSQYELDKMMAHPFVDTLERVRDLFVLQCYLGVRVSDLFRVDQNIQENKISIETKKMKKVVGIPITPIVRGILKKYSLPDGIKLPRMSEQKYRLGIKQVYKTINPKAVVQVRDSDRYESVPVWSEISSHDAVRTFITLSAERGMSIKSIAQITGKTIPVLLKNYLVESQQQAESEMLAAWK